MATGEHGTTPAEVLDLLSKLLHREILRLALLVAIAIAAFFVTRAIAENNRQRTLRHADGWYWRGQQQLAAGNVEDAVDSFRRARLRNRSERKFVLALSQALVALGDTAGAQNALLSLRQTEPEDATVNLALARIAAGQGDVGDAVRYYQNALYAPWPPGQESRRRSVRVEMVDLLLEQHQGDRAIPELIALTTDLPDTTALRIPFAQRLAFAGDHRRALEQFEIALRHEPSNSAAIAGAARAAFQVGDYTRAARHLRRIPPDSTALQQLSDVVGWTLRSDPLAPRISPAERTRRLEESFAYANARLRACPGTATSGSDAAIILAGAGGFAARLESRRIAADSTIDQGLELIHRMERVAIDNCGNATARDQALMLIAERHKPDVL